MQVSVQIDTPNPPLVAGKPVHTVSWTATRQDDGHVSYAINAHHYGPDDAPLADRLTPVMRAKSIDPAAVPDWVPWPPANWLASLEPDGDDLQAIIDAETYHFEHSGAGSWRS